MILSHTPPDRASSRYVWTRRDGLRVLDVPDGDNVHALFFPACKSPCSPMLRLLGIQAPELRGPSRAAGLAARDHLAALLGDAEDMTLQTHQTKVETQAQTFTRYLAQLWVQRSGVWRNVSAEMLDAEHATPYDGGLR